MASAGVQELAALALGRYPRFIYRNAGRHADPGYVPVFCFHTLDPADFDEKLRFLSANEYRTITLDDVWAWMCHGKPLPPRAVVLTIDDGRMSTWTVGYPLLDKHGMVATAFIIPGYVGDGTPRPTLQDVWESRATIDEVVSPEAVDRVTTVNWSEVEAMHRSGAVRIESHSMLHRRVPISNSLSGFITPRVQGPIFEVPLDPSARQTWTEERLQANWGAPLFESAPFLSVTRACRIPQDATGACVDLVRREGGAGFFQRADWFESLRQTVLRHDLNRMQLTDVAEDQAWELQASKQEIERRLPGKIVRHLCFPNGRGTALSTELSKAAGYATCCWSLLAAGQTNRVRCDPHRLGRLKHDFIHRLPGDSRRSLASIMAGKLRRRSRGETGY